MLSVYIQKKRRYLPDLGSRTYFTVQPADTPVPGKFSGYNNLPFFHRDFLLFQPFHTSWIVYLKNQFHQRRLFFIAQHLSGHFLSQRKVYGTHQDGFAGSCFTGKNI